MNLDPQGVPPVKSIWKHKGRGTLYIVTGISKFQCSTERSLDERTMVHYRGTNGEPYSRLAGEFLDGRFEPLATFEWLSFTDV